MKTFNYESNCVKYKDCYFDIGHYEKDKISIDIYGRINNDKDISHISALTVNVEEKLAKDCVILDTYANSNLVSFLIDLGVVKRIVARTVVKLIILPVVELDMEKLKEYSFDYKKELRYA